MLAILVTEIHSFGELSSVKEEHEPVHEMKGFGTIKIFFITLLKWRNLI